MHPARVGEWKSVFSAVASYVCLGVTVSFRPLLGSLPRNSHHVSSRTWYPVAQMFTQFAETTVTIHLCVTQYRTHWGIIKITPLIDNSNHVSIPVISSHWCGLIQSFWIATTIYTIYHCNLEIEVKVHQVEIDQMQEKWITCLVSMHFYDRSIH